jgi:hypothetical protein
VQALFSVKILLIPEALIFGSRFLAVGQPPGGMTFVIWMINQST